MEILLWISVFALSLTALVKASDWFVESAEKIGLAIGIPPFIIGVTIVAFGTSLPELAASIAAVWSGSSEIVVGNVVGSNITNILLILGVVAVVGKRVETKVDIMAVDIPMLVGSAFLLWFVLRDLQVLLPEAIILLIALIIFLAHSFSSGGDEKTERQPIPMKAVGLLLLSGILIYFGATYTIVAIEKLSAILGINKEIIALTMVAFGTSLPELVVSIAAARKGQPEMAVGNVLGSNIFNTYAVMGIPALFENLVIPENIMGFGLPMMIAATFLFAYAALSKGIDRSEGFLLLLFYIYFVAELFVANG